MSVEAYDVNFFFPVPETLESERVKLTPFIAEQLLIHQLHNQLNDNSLQSMRMFSLRQQFLSVLVEGRIHPNPACILFAVYDKTRTSTDAAAVEEGAFAGTIGLLETSMTNLSTEIGFIMISPSFRRTHVTSNAIALLLRYTLDLPSQGGLGLRRVAWKASPNNLTSIKAAERLGFGQECVARWAFVLPEEKQIGNGLERRKEDPRVNCLGRDTVILSICWDEWEDGGRTRANAIMGRRS